VDLTLLMWFNQSLASPLLDKLMVAVTLGGFALLPALGVTLLLGRKRRVGLAILVALAMSFIVVMIFQFSVMRPRPATIRLLLPTPHFPSYPSGHAAAAFSTALVLGLSYRRLHGWVLALAGAGLIAFSRVYLGHHYPSDILGGAIIGAGIGAACYGLIVAQSQASEFSANPTGEKQCLQTGWHWFLWPQIALALVISQIAYLDLLPGALLRYPLTDKVFHFLLIGSIAFWLNLWLAGRRVPLGRWLVPLAVLIPLVVALAEEIAQKLSPVRSSDPLDFLSDVVGLLFFWWLSQKLSTFRRFETQNPPGVAPS
jgi:membrane-associated phospholipid phosphatase